MPVTLPESAVTFTGIRTFAAGTSKTQQKRFSEALKSFVRDHAMGVVVPHFQNRLTAEFASNDYRVEVSDDGELLRVHYSSVLALTGDYMASSVLIEFGGRNITEPNEEHEIGPDIAKFIPDLVFPRSTVSVLSPARTFWEKATLMHVESQRGLLRANADRLSRHWYDLVMLADLDIGRVALENRALLVDVVKHKKVFYNTSYANYDDCLIGKLRLLPDEAGLASLAQDFQRMIDAGMFMGVPPAFTQIIERLRSLEIDINKLQ